MTHATKPRRKWLTLRRRRYLYGVALASVPVAIAAGLITAEVAAAVVPLAAAVLGVGSMALANPTRE